MYNFAIITRGIFCSTCPFVVLEVHLVESVFSRITQWEFEGIHQTPIRVRCHFTSVLLDRWNELITRWCRGKLTVICRRHFQCSELIRMRRFQDSGPINGHQGDIPWASYQIRKSAGCACAGNVGNVSPPPRISDLDMHHGTCVTHVPWCMPGSLTSGFLWSRWRGKRSRHSRCMRNPQFCVSGKRPVLLSSFICAWYLQCIIRWMLPLETERM